MREMIERKGEKGEERRGEERRGDREGEEEIEREREGGKVGKIRWRVNYSSKDHTLILPSQDPLGKKIRQYLLISHPSLLFSSLLFSSLLFSSLLFSSLSLSLSPLSKAYR
jgi:hypothetical protein